MDEEGELHQYVVYEQTKPKGPKIIKLDDPKGKGPEVENYTPPTSIMVHLSKIDMPELKPRANIQPPENNIMKRREKIEKEQEKEKAKEKGRRKDKRKEDDKKQKPSPSPPPPGKLAKPFSASSKPPPSPGHSAPPQIPEHSRPAPNAWALYPSLFNQPPYPQGSGALNTGTPPPPPPQLSSVVSNLFGRLDPFARR